MQENIIPYIGGEEEKSQEEPKKILGDVHNGIIIPSNSPRISAQCIRVPVEDGHLATVWVRFMQKPPKEEILNRWANFDGIPQRLQLPSAPNKPLQ